MTKPSIATSAAYKVPEVAQQLHCGPRAVYALINDGKIPYLKLGRNFVIPKAAFHRWLDNGGK